MNYSGAFRRLAAFTIDCIVIISFYVTIGFVLSFSALFAHLVMLPMLGFWFYGGMFFFGWMYFALSESSKHQATIGKKVLGLKVVSLKGKRIGFWRASVRYFSKILSRILLMLGFIMIFFTKKKQALHDKIAATLIIQK